MPICSGGPAPYAPPATVLQLVTSYRNRGLQTPFTSEVLERAGVASSVVPRTMQAIRLLDLVDEQGNPTPAFEALRRAGENEYRDRLAELVRTAYAEIFQYVDPATDDSARVRDAFRNYEPIGQLGRMVTLFVGLCEAAGIIPEGTRRPAAPAATRRSGAGGPTRRREQTGASASSSRGFRNSPSGYDQASIPPDAYAHLYGVLSGLPSPTLGWTQAQRDKFVEAFGNLLDFTIPIRSADEIAGAHHESGGDNNDE